MSRRTYYPKNIPLIANPPRIRQPNQRGIYQPQQSHFRGAYNDFNTNSYHQYDTRFGEESPFRARGHFRGRGTLRNDFRSTLRNNTNNYVIANHREEETFKVTIPMSAKYEQLYLTDLLRENLTDPSVAFYNFQKEQNSYVFFVVGHDIAETLRNMSRRIATDCGQRLVILMRKSTLLCANLDDRVEGIIKSTMSRLYNLNTRVMKLDNFREAEEFKQHGLFITVGKTHIIRYMVNVILDNTPNLRALNLTDNKLIFLHHLQPLASKCAELQALELSNNKIQSLSELDSLKGLKLRELTLEGNPFVDNFPSPASYINAMRKLFPGLQKLDNEDLPNVIGFDLDVVQSLPETRGNTIPQEMESFVFQFLEAFYKLYDSQDRKCLMQAYHDKATFSYSFSNHDHSNGYRMSSLDSHNILRLRDESLWVKLVKTTNAEIVSLLCTFPASEHDPDSFKIDIPHCEANLIIIVVNGAFNEPFKAHKPMRSFCRTFFVVPQGSGFVIVNEMFVVSNPSAKQSIERNKTKREPNGLASNPDSDRLMSTD